MIEDGDVPAKPLIMGLAVVAAQKVAVVDKVLGFGVDPDDLGDVHRPGRRPDLHVPELIFPCGQGFIQNHGLGRELAIVHPVPGLDDFDGFLGRYPFLFVFLAEIHKISL